MPEMSIRGNTAPEDIQRGEMRVMGRKGDTRIIWDPSNEIEVTQARKTFDDLRGKGFLAFAVAQGGGKGTQITDFDPAAEKLILAPPMAGGSGRDLYDVAREVTDEVMGPGSYAELNRDHPDPHVRRAAATATLFTILRINRRGDRQINYYDQQLTIEAADWNDFQQAVRKA
jgi:hypothetical protein